MEPILDSQWHTKNQGKQRWEIYIEIFWFSKTLKDQADIIISIGSICFAKYLKAKALSCLLSAFMKKENIKKNKTSKCGQDKHT